MRRVVDVFVVLTVLVVVVFVLRNRPSAEASTATVADVQTSLTRLYDRAAHHGRDDALTEAQTEWPVAMLPEWFGDQLPTNPLLPGVATGRSHRQINQPRPWLDIAPPGDLSLHPPDPVAVRTEQAQFWYNPNLGLFRARVAAHLAEDEALSLYNQINGLELAHLERDTDPTRTPLAYDPGTLPSATLASREPAVTTNATSTTPTRPKPSLFMSDPAPTYAELTPAPAEPPAAPTGRRRLKDQPH